MTKKEVCLQHDSFAYYSGFGGVEFKHIEYGVNDYVYLISGAWTTNKSYHKLKVYYDDDDGDYIKLNGCKIPFNECIRMN